MLKGWKLPSEAKRILSNISEIIEDIIFVQIDEISVNLDFCIIQKINYFQMLNINIF